MNLKKIQKYLKQNKINIFLINRTDEFLNEYIAPYAERLKWISNFSGSAGRAIILENKAYIFVDGRYSYQVRGEVNKKFFLIKHLKDYWKILEKSIKKNFYIGIDPYHHSCDEFKILNQIITRKKSKIHFFNKNPIDLFWNNQPRYPKSKIFIHEYKFSGKTSFKKLKHVQSNLLSKKIDFYILTKLDSIAWLLNIRGNDMIYSPLFLSYAIVPKKGKIQLFVDKYKIKNIEKKINKIANIHPIQNISKFIYAMEKNCVVGFDESNIPFKFKILCKKNNIYTINFTDPCIYLKAEKNKIELQGARNANLRDGLSITKFLYWLKNNKNINKYDEIKAAKYLYKLRSSNHLFFSLSFETISAIGKNAALPHYRVSSQTNQKFYKNCIYLVDSGAQYKDGTTDITRTVVIGDPTKEHKDRFTRVLKGHIAVSKLSFKKNIKGSKIDYVARKSLKEIGCDYDHGTGHGIGSFLNVHEGPQRISKISYNNEGELRNGMILSNEPGFYKKNKYGIRIENLIIIKSKTNKLSQFETISFAPIDSDLIDLNILSKLEIDWLNQYHAEVFKKLKNKLDTKERAWLREVTKPL